MKIHLYDQCQTTADYRTIIRGRWQQPQPALQTFGLTKLPKAFANSLPCCLLALMLIILECWVYLRDDVLNRMRFIIVDSCFIFLWYFSFVRFQCFSEKFGFMFCFVIQRRPLMLSQEVKLLEAYVSYISDSTMYTDFALSNTTPSLIESSAAWDFPSSVRRYDIAFLADFSWCTSSESCSSTNWAISVEYRKKVARDDGFLEI